MSAKMGAPRKEIDWDQFEKLCGLHCTRDEIAGWFRISEDTLDRRVKEHYDETFAAVFKQKRSNGRVSLRRKMMEVAMNGSIPMLIFLSKNLLGFGDRVVTETATENEASKLIIDMSGEQSNDQKTKA